MPSGNLSLASARPFLSSFLPVTSGGTSRPVSFLYRSCSVLNEGAVASRASEMASTPTKPGWPP